jgi:hypothetical protein
MVRDRLALVLAFTDTQILLDLTGRCLAVST